MPQKSRGFEEGSGVRAGKTLDPVEVPSFYPNNEIIRSDLVDYRLEIEWFDQHLNRMIKELEHRGELQNTLIVVTSDNGMPFPRAKATLYEAGTRVPLAIQWPARVPAGRTLKKLVSFVDLAPTFLEAAGLPPRPEMAGRSLLDILTSDFSAHADTVNDFVVLGKERHNHARADNLGYPTRAIRTPRYLYIRNFKPERWPMGDPPGYFCHTKMINPTKKFILAKQDDAKLRRFYEMTYAKRPAEELYLIASDPDCLHNLATDPTYSEVRTQLRSRLNRILKSQADPRLLGHGDIFEGYPYFGRMQPGLNGFQERGQYNPQFASPKSR